MNIKVVVSTTTGVAMSKRISLAGSIGVALLTAISACGGSSAGARPVFASDLTSSQYQAAYFIAAARCDRQTPECGTFPSREACIGAKLPLTASEARLYECSDPIDDKQLDACVAEVRRGQCGTGIANVAACRQSSICPAEHPIEMFLGPMFSFFAKA